MVVSSDISRTLPSVSLVIAFLLLVADLTTTALQLPRQQPPSLLACTSLPLASGVSSSTCSMTKLPKKQLPEKLIVGYANWNQCDDSLIQAVQQGVNVLIWFSINLAADDLGIPVITNGPDTDCVAEKVRIMAEMGLDVVHLISIGGWNSPHPDTRNGAEEVFAHWNHWNRNIIARPEKGFYGFDGIDWDIEGNDTPSSPYNCFAVEALDLMGKFSQLAKAKGYFVAMAPAESYLDPTTSAFDRSLLHEYEEWKGVIPKFAYHGLNTYAYLLSRYREYVDPDNDDIRGETFDFVTIQLYEGYSHAQYKIFVEKQPADLVLVEFVKMVTQCWEVDFSTDTALNYPVKSMISIASDKLVVGLANGWAGDGKFLLVYPQDIAAAYNSLEEQGTKPRGFAFWNILDEGKAPPCDPSNPIWLTKKLNDFLHIRR